MTRAPSPACPFAAPLACFLGGTPPLPTSLACIPACSRPGPRPDTPTHPLSLTSHFAHPLDSSALLPPGAMLCITVPTRELTASLRNRAGDGPCREHRPPVPWSSPPHPAAHTPASIANDPDMGSFTFYAPPAEMVQVLRTGWKGGDAASPCALLLGKWSARHGSQPAAAAQALLPAGIAVVRKSRVPLSEH